MPFASNFRDVSLLSITEKPLSAISYDVTSYTIGQAFNATASITGEVSKVVLDINSTLPAGLHLNESTGAVTGTTAVSGTFKVIALDKYGNTAGVVEFMDAAIVTSVTIENSDQSYQQVTASGGTHELPDIDINIKDGAATLETVTRVSATDQDVDISAHRPDATVENSDQSYSESVSPGSTHVLPDIDITINDGSTEITVVSREAAIDQAVDISSLILRPVLWMNQTTYDALGSTDADTHYIIDDDLDDDEIKTIYDA